MNFLLFSGPSNSGKTSSIILYKEFLLTNGYSEVMLNKKGTDFSSILENGSRKILVHTASDLVGCINELHHHFSKNQDVNAVIAGCRNHCDWRRDYLFHKMDLSNAANYYFEIPLGRSVTGINRGVSTGWYLDNVLEVAKKVGSMSPFSF